MSYELISREQHKARKPHVCTWCGEPIAIGETYERMRFVYEGDPMVNKMHAECHEAAGAWEGEFYPGSFKRGSLEER